MTTRFSLMGAACCACMCAFSAFAELTVSDAWARSTFKFATSGAAYLTLHNATDAPVQLVSATVSSEVADKVEFHETLIEDELAKMRPLSLPLHIASQQELAFVPGGKHIMLLGLNGPLSSGETFTLTLTYADDTEQQIEVAIKEGKKDDGGHHHHHH